jgi:hypothetical protein
MVIFCLKSRFFVVLRGFWGTINRKQNTEHRRQHKNGGIASQSDISNLRFQISLKYPNSNKIDVAAGDSTNVVSVLQIEKKCKTKPIVTAEYRRLNTEVRRKNEKQSQFQNR